MLIVSSFLALRGEEPCTNFPDISIFIDYIPSNSALELRSKARRLHTEYGLDVIEGGSFATDDGGNMSNLRIVPKISLWQTLLRIYCSNRNEGRYLGGNEEAPLLGFCPLFGRDVQL